VRIGSIDGSKLARTAGEYLQLVESDADWIARSAEDVRRLREAAFGPFAKLPEDDFREFLAILEFRRRGGRRGGLAAGYYRPLMRSLTLTELFEVFGCFGMSSELFLRGIDLSCQGDERTPFPGRFCLVGFFGATGAALQDIVPSGNPTEDKPGEPGLPPIRPAGGRRGSGRVSRAS
jgi:hypothetical protein